MKCFEIGKIYEASASQMLLTVNMKCFEITHQQTRLQLMAN